MIKKRAFLHLLLLGVLVLSGCATQQPRFDTESICDLEKLTLQNTTPVGPLVSKIRLQALKETALTLGAQGALALRSKELNKMLEDQAEQLDQIYNFSGLMLDNDVLPPVLEASSQSLNLNSPSVLTLSDHTYKIAQQARFVTAVPTWRDYLSMNYQKPKLPDNTLLPKTDKEREIWIQYVKIGWQQGIDQANNIYANNLALLKRDYQGMMLYRSLLAKQMVTEPRVAGVNLGVTSNADKTEMQVNNRLLQISATPAFQTNSESWKPILVQKR